VNAQERAILDRLRAALDEAYGDRIERVVLFGSRARGDAKPDSDYDVAVFLKDHRSASEENSRLAEITTHIMLETGAVINAIPLLEGSYVHRTLFMHEVRKDGVEL